MAKILVIDDDQSVLDLLSLRLTGAGYTVITALDGIAGFMLATREKPNAIILDYNMPAANGAKVHERLRGNTFTASTPIIFLTAGVVTTMITQVKSDNHTSFLDKPLDFDKLARTLAHFLGPATPAAPGKPPAKPVSFELPDNDGHNDPIDLDSE